MSALARLFASVLALGVLAAAGWQLFSDGGDRYVVEAVFDDLRGIRKNSDVKIAGVPGGEVERIELDRHDRAMVRMELSEGAAPIGAGATARVRPVNLLGEVYIDLDPGDLTRPRRSGTRIPLTRTGAPVELDDLLNILDPDTRTRLRLLINEAGLALLGRGSDLNDLLARLPQPLDRLRALLAELEGENRTMAELVDRGDRLLSAVNGRRDQLGRLVSAAGAALSRTARHHEELGATVAAAPAGLDQLRTTLARLGDTAGDLGPLGATALRAAPPLANMLGALPGFARAAAPTLATARGVAPALTRLGREGTAPVARLEGSALRLAAFATDLTPFVQTLDEGGMSRLLSMLDYLGKVQESSDGLGHLFRLHGVLTPDFLTTALTRYGRGSAASGSDPAASAPRVSGSIPAAPAPTREPVTTESPTQGSGPAPAEPISPPPVDPTPQGPVRDLLDFLLGG